jgi:hypothetical protein
MSKVNTSASAIADTSAHPDIRQAGHNGGNERVRLIRCTITSTASVAVDAVTDAHAGTVVPSGTAAAMTNPTARRGPLRTLVVTYPKATDARR